MEIDWNSIIWFVIWAAVIIAAVAFTIWVVFALFVARRIKESRRDFDKGFDSDFFKNARKRF